MAWSDEPSDSQLNTLYRWFSWNMSNVKAREAVNYLRENSTRHDVSIEIGRIKKLFDSHALTEENAFESDIWADFSQGGNNE